VECSVSGRLVVFCQWEVSGVFPVGAPFSEMAATSTRTFVGTRIDVQSTAGDSR